jgi:valyl-tRNA synthetase
MQISNKYDAKTVEDKWRKYWEDSQIYKSFARPEKEKYTVVIPPPNVTGILHIGHILNNTIQDIYCRWKRMNGFEVCWVPGMDHAGIATQIKVEQELKKKGISKNELGREEFIKVVWEWKEKFGGLILKQLRKLGVSVDWSKERFTLDKGLSKAVKEVFVDLYKKGLIYKGKRIVNWDNLSQTALSDDEISYVEKQDKLYYIKYPVPGEESELIIATTRPETMLGDTAVAVNPSDSRYSYLKDKQVILPILNKNIPVVFDGYVDMEFGTGALKITPAHDINDFEIGEKYNLNFINVFTKDGKINENGYEFMGLSIENAREEVIKKLKELGLLVKIENYTHNVAVSERTGAIIEPYLSDQWFVSMKKLAEPAVKVVEEGKIKFHPEKWVKTYYYWLKNVKDWCISRQLWWGHQIPIWYHKKTNKIYCEINPPSDIENWKQDTDVLDTWFSSWLWPFSVFGWENSIHDKTNRELNYYYPTDFLSTAPEIIFLWVARMIMSGLEYMKDIPFKDVYFHSTVRDGIGRKMSKSLGNSPDPLDVMDKYGTDALRFTLVYLSPLGNDVFYEEDKTEIGRNFVTKIWNAGRFLLLNNENNKENLSDDTINDFTEEWLTYRFNDILALIEQNLDEYRLNDYTKSIHTYIWDDFCDWYIEMVKIKLKINPESSHNIIKTALMHFEDILKILHPVMPFVTEELWNIVRDKPDINSISFSQFPVRTDREFDLKLIKKFNELKEISYSIRNLRSESKIPFKQKLDVFIKLKNEKLIVIDELKVYIENLCNVTVITDKNSVCNFDNSQSKILPDYDIILFPEIEIDSEKQRENYEKELKNLNKYLENINKKLSNEKFLSNASDEVIENEKLKYSETKSKIDKLNKLLKR